VFLDLSSELRRQGLNNKLIADLFGLSLRTYHNKIKRLSESTTDRGRPLWNAVLDFVQQQGTVARGEVAMRFCRDDEATVKSVLNDLVEVGLVFSKGKGDATVYRAASIAELDLGPKSNESDALDNLVWISIARHSPITCDELVELAQLPQEQVEAALGRLEREGRVERHRDDGNESYSSAQCVIPLGQSAGWEAAVFDHYQAVVTAICAKLDLGNARSERGERVGGSTYSFEVWPGHPLYAEALGLLQELRDRAVSLRTRVGEVNRTHERPAQGVRRIVSYIGQNVIDAHDTTETP
jgi:predicted transcriptional regulator